MNHKIYNINIGRRSIRHKSRSVFMKSKNMFLKKNISGNKAFPSVRILDSISLMSKWVANEDTFSCPRTELVSFPICVMNITQTPKHSKNGIIRNCVC